MSFWVLIYSPLPYMAGDTQEMKAGAGGGRVSYFEITQAARFSTHAHCHVLIPNIQLISF